MESELLDPFRALPLDLVEGIRHEVTSEMKRSIKSEMEMDSAIVCRNTYFDFIDYFTDHCVSPLFVYSMRLFISD